MIYTTEQFVLLENRYKALYEEGKAGKGRSHGLAAVVLEMLKPDEVLEFVKNGLLPPNACGAQTAVVSAPQPDDEPGSSQSAGSRGRSRKRGRQSEGLSEAQAQQRAQQFATRIVKGC